jgi:hypothetical protein
MALEPDRDRCREPQLAAWAARLRNAATRGLHEEAREPVTAIRESTGELLALADDTQVWFAPAIEALERDHPRWRFAATLSLVAKLMQKGDEPHPYEYELAAYYTRYILIPSEVFARYADGENDARLAERFNVPLDQIAAKRRDLMLEDD